MNIGLLPITSALGATPLFPGKETVQFEVIVCDRTKNGDQFQDFRTWVGIITRAVCEAAGGCQVYHGEGRWIRQEDAQLFVDNIATIRATTPRDRFLEHLKRIRWVLKQYGREAEQESVCIILNGELFLIDPSAPY